MIYLLATNYTATFAGAMATLTLIVLALFCRLIATALREGAGGLLRALTSMIRDVAIGAVDGGKGLIMISVLLGCAGILTAIIGATGLGTKVSGELLAIAGDRLLIALVISAVLCMLLGMDVPTTASYVLTASVAAPLLTKLGLPPLTAHLFIFYFAILSAITPPVCASVFAAAAIAGESFWRVARYALLIAGGVYFLPFMMVYRPGLLMAGSLFDIAYATLITAVAMFCLASASIGYLWHSLSMPARLLIALIGFLYFIPGLVYDASATVLLIGFILVQRNSSRRIASASTPVQALRPNSGDLS